MKNMAILRKPLTHIILHSLCVLCVVIVEVKPILVYKGCPVDCYCSPDTSMPETWALKADCGKELKEVPQLTPNITTLTLEDVASFIDGFTFSGGSSLRILSMWSSSSPMNIHSNAFKPLKALSTLSLSSIPGLSRIPSEILCEILHIKHLSLEVNDISSISFDPCVAKVRTKLSSLRLSHNPLETIQADNFIELQDHNVTGLYLDECDLTDLQPGLFQHLPHLIRLDISINGIKFLLPGVFSNLSNLRYLSIADNRLTSLTFQDDYPFIPVLQRFKSSVINPSDSNVSFSRAFLSATSLDSLNILLEDTENLQEDVFANLIRSPVKTMTLWMFSVIRISSSAFDPLRFLQTAAVYRGGDQLEPEAMYNISISLGRLPLQTLIISNPPRALNNKTFEGFHPNNNLRVLNIDSDSGIERIGRNTFQYLNKVENLTISGCNLRSDALEAGAFRGLNSLRKLDLRQNQLRSLPRRVHLDVSATVRALDLSDNDITGLLEYNLREWSNLTLLNLGENKILIILGLSHGFVNLETLYLHSNKITFLSDRHFMGMPFLKKITLADNDGTEISGSAFQNSDVLEHLDLGNNPFAKYSTEYAFLNLSSLKVLKLSGCAITILQDEMFNHNRMLKELYLDHNYVVSWQPEVFRPLRKLTYLSMAKNMIADVHETAFKYLISLTRLDLSGNPLACTCKLLWFKHWISTSNVYLIGYNIKERYICASPEQEQYRPLIDFQLTVDDCVSHFLFNLVMGLVVGILLMGTVLSLAHRFRWYIRYCIFLVRSRRRQMYDALVEDETFKYDVYVCYHNTSRHWVINELLRKLEYEAGIKLCLHDRNWLAGPTIMDNIIESIEQSRKTLLLVNNGFAQSVWCREETSLAYHRLIETQRNMLIVVLLEDVQQENMDRLLRSILTKRVYLKYSQSKKKEPRFWKALKAALRKGEHAVAGVELQHEYIHCNYSD